MPLLPEPAVQLPAVDLVKAVPVIMLAFVLSAAYPAAISRTEFGVVPSLERVKPLIKPFTTELLDPPDDLFVV